MSPADELRHLHEGAGDAPPPADSDTIEAAGGERALARAREVLEAVLTTSATASEWPGVSEWRERLPAWFVDACVDDAELRDCVLDKWSLRGWTYWFQPDLRQWRWWDARAEGDRVLVTLAVLRRPYLRGALEWLLQAAAA